MKITDINQLDFNKLYTVADYLNWEFSDRLELIKGRIFKMSPAPNVNDQTICQNLYSKIRACKINKDCRIYLSPIDVYLGTKKTTVVQPDLIVVCDSEKIKLKGCIGSPDLIVEILSPGNSRKEMDYKYSLYEEEGVQEYWIVFPSERILQIYKNLNGQFSLIKSYTDGMNAVSELFPDLNFEVSEIFEGMIEE